MKKYIDNFLKFQPLLLELVSRDIKTKYRRSILGVFWTLLNPLLMMIVLSVVFSNLFRFQIENFPLYLLSGQIIFNFFSESTQSGMQAIINSASLIKKVYIPKYLFVFAKILSSTINIFASFCALIFVMIFTRAELHYTVILVIFPLALIIIFSTGVALILAAFAVKFRDIVHLYSVFLTAFMYLTPIIYPISILSGFIRKIVMINPLTNILEIFRGLVIYNTLPSLQVIMLAVIPCAIILILGMYVFYKNQDNFIMYI